MDILEIRNKGIVLGTDLAEGCLGYSMLAAAYQSAQLAYDTVSGTFESDVSAGETLSSGLDTANSAASIIFLAFAMNGVQALRNRYRTEAK